MPLLDDFTNDLKKCEGLRLGVYDDANDFSVQPGYKLTGHPTIGYGRALDTNGISKDEATYLLSNDASKVLLWVTNNVPVFNSLSPIRQRVVANMVYNLGKVGFMGFVNFRACLAKGDYEGAADNILCSAAAREDVNRYKWLAAMMRSDQEVDFLP